MKPFTAWIAVSRYGHPAPYVGWHFTRKVLRDEYTAHFQRDLQADGYQAVKVQMSPASMRGPAPAGEASA